MNNELSMVELNRCTIKTVTSKDGTAIGYRQLGHGPGLVLLHGAASSGYNHMQLAEALAESFTVYVPDRRGRGLSGPYRKDYSIQDDIDDLEVLLTKTDTHNVFGVSSGGIICLQAALTLPGIYKAAIYEPPFFVNDSITPKAVLKRFDEQMAQGKSAAALVTGMKGARMGPSIFSFLPDWLLERLVAIAMRREDERGSGEYVSMRMLAPTLHDDFQLVVEMNDALEDFRSLRCEVLLLGGGKSPAYLKTALSALEKVLPRAHRVVLLGLDHAASWNTDRGGQPGLVAKELRRFFTARRNEKS